MLRFSTQAEVASPFPQFPALGKILGKDNDGEAEEKGEDEEDEKKQTSTSRILRVVPHLIRV